MYLVSGKFSVMVPSHWAPYLKYPTRPMKAYRIPTANIDWLKTPKYPPKLFGVSIFCSTDRIYNSQRRATLVMLQLFVIIFSHTTPTASNANSVVPTNNGNFLPSPTKSRSDTAGKSENM